MFLRRGHSYFNEAPIGADIAFSNRCVALLQTRLRDESERESPRMVKPDLFSRLNREEESRNEYAWQCEESKEGQCLDLVGVDDPTEQHQRQC